MFNAAMLDKVKPGVRIVNIGRGPVIDEQVLASGLADGIIHSVALDVFEVEPLPADSPLRRYDLNIFGSHNGSNTQDAVRRVRSEEHTSELQSLMRISYAVFCLKKKKKRKSTQSEQ